MTTNASPLSEGLMPAEWEPHDATWIAWPHHEDDWPGKLEPIHWVYAEIVRALSGGSETSVGSASTSVRPASSRSDFGMASSSVRPASSRSDSGATSSGVGPASSRSNFGAASSAMGPASSRSNFGASGNSERIEILCHDKATAERARQCLDTTAVPADVYRLHLVPNDRSWLRDSAPTAVHLPDGRVAWRQWRFNAWAKYDNHHQDVHVPEAIAAITHLPLLPAVRPDTGQPFVMEGGAFDTDGEGTLLVTEECLLSDTQVRNPGLDRSGYEEAFAQHLGIRKVIWLGAGCAGDDTHGHVDDIARFVAPGVVVTVYEPDPADANHAPLADNVERLRAVRDAAGRPLRVHTLPMPAALYYDGMRLPASYANFYIANRTVIVPTFNDPNDRVALNLLADLFPTRRIVGIHAVDLVLGFGTLHCLTQQQPAPTQ